MTTTRPNVDPDGHYIVKDTAKALGVDRHTVRRYEQRGLLKPRIRFADCRKVYTGAQIIRCWERMYL